MNLGLVIDRTAKLAAYLMWKHQIPLSHVVPHYHWPRLGVTPYRKACPHLLMDKAAQVPNGLLLKTASLPTITASRD